MSIENESGEQVFDAHAEATAIFSSAFGQDQESEAAAEPGPGEGGDPSEPDGEVTLDDQEDEKPEDEPEGKSGKKVSRWQRQKQRTAKAEAKVTELKGKAHEALDHAIFFESELKAQTDRVTFLESQLEELGYGQTEAEQKLTTFETNARSETHRKAASEAAAKRESESEKSTAEAEFKSQIVEAGLKHGVKDWVQVARFMQAFPDTDLDTAASEVAARSKRSQAPTPAAKQASKNSGAPAVLSASVGTVAKRPAKRSLRDEFISSLSETGLYR